MKTQFTVETVQTCIMQSLLANIGVHAVFMSLKFCLCDQRTSLCTKL